ncbi:MAG: aminodeoxychorismate/anthranilate synthase component II [Nitrospirae bacterium]|nr:aminodeoxychorismate/anthranilate synthase component II [Nitrospirota bacterium]
MILVIDNYDSFTYNLVQYLGELGADVSVHRNDKIDIQTIRKMKPKKILISPGPGTPSQAGISNEVIKTFGKDIPLLGVCLGHQCLAHVFGGKIVRAKRLMHGKTSLIHHNKKDIYQGLKNPFVATRYHSLILARDSVPACLKITAETEEKEIMGLKHRKYPLWGVQFHPESILTEEGKKLLDNFLKM